MLFDDGSVVVVCRDVASCWLIVMLVVGSCRCLVISVLGGMPWLSVVGYEPMRDRLLKTKKGCSIKVTESPLDEHISGECKRDDACSPE